MNKFLKPLLSTYLKGTKRKFIKFLGFENTYHPYMKFKEIHLLEELIRNLNPKKCLEYGCGISSLHFSKLLKEGSKWYSIEHDMEWYHKIQGLNQFEDKLEIYFVGSDNSSWRHEGYYNDFKTYINFPEKLSKFDFILVDGMARESCIKKAYELLSENGVMIIHDCNRIQYHEELKIFPNWMIIEDYRKTAGGIGICTKSKSIESLFDLEYHQKVWEMDTLFQNFFKFKYLIGKEGF